MSSPHMSFRLNHYHLAKALRILVTLEPNQPIASLSQAAKLIIIDWISKHSINMSLNTSQADIEAVKHISKLSTEQIDPYTTIQTIMAQAKEQSGTSIIPQTNFQEQSKQTVQQIQRTIEDEKLFNDLRCEAQSKQSQHKAQQEQNLDKEIAEQIKLSTKPSEFNDPNNTDSDIPSVTDFSPPNDWKE